MTAFESYKLIKEMHDVMPINQLCLNIFFIVIIGITLIQVFTKWNPWTAILVKIGDVINAKTNKRIDDLENKLDGHIKEDNNYKAMEWRKNILDFSRNIIKHGNDTEEAYENIMDDINDYLEFVKRNKITNEKATRAIANIRFSYDNHCQAGDFLKEDINE